MPSKGLLMAGGIGKGLLSGLQGFRQARDDEREASRDAIAEKRMADAERAQRTGLLLKAQEAGYEIDPSGGLIETETGRKNRELAGREREAKLGLLRAQSEYYRGKGKSGGGLGALTPGQKEADKAFGKEYQERLTSGNDKTQENDLSTLRDAVKMLKKTDMASGPLIGFMPKGMRDRVTPTGAGLQDRVEGIISKNLKTILGSQFTERDRMDFIKTSYNPNLSEAENASRIEKIASRLAESTKNQRAMDAYFREHGTLAGFDGAGVEDPSLDEPPEEFGPDADLRTPNFRDDGIMAVLEDELMRGHAPNAINAVAPAELLSAVGSPGMQTVYNQGAKGLVPAGVTGSASLGNKATALARRSENLGAGRGLLSGAGKAVAKGAGKVVDATMLPRGVRALKGLIGR